MCLATNTPSKLNTLPKYLKYAFHKTKTKAILKMWGTLPSAKGHQEFMVQVSLILHRG